MAVRRCLLFVLATMFILWISAADSLAQKPRENFVEIEFPIGDIEVKLVESSRGMILAATSHTIRMRARRIYFGDGKHAVKYEASNLGIDMPNRVKNNVAGFTLDDGTTISVDQTRLEEWGIKPNEVYVNVPNLKLKARDQKRRESESKEDESSDAPNSR